MREFQRTGVECPDYSERFPGHDIFGVLAANFGLEAVHHPRLQKTLHTLRHRSLKNHIEGVFIVARCQNFGLAFDCFTEAPVLVVKYTLFPLFASTAGRRRREMPTMSPFVSVTLACSKQLKYIPDPRHAREL